MRKGNKPLTGNYRPIRLTFIASWKTYGSHHSRNKCKSFRGPPSKNDSQHGIRQNRSCMMKLLDFFFGTINTYDESKVVDVVYLEFQKAFDKVLHQRLQAKIKSLGTDWVVFQWIGNWSTGRELRNEYRNDFQHEQLQSDIDKLMNWAHKWLMNLNINKGKVL